MGDPKSKSSPSSSSSSSSPFSLPPGCRFYPSEEQLLCYYLHHKNNTTNINTHPISSSHSSSLNPKFCDAIKEINLYNYNPFELPEVTCFRFGYRGRKRHWYCYTQRVEEEREREREIRSAGFGYWKRKGKVRDVMGNGGKVILGRRNRFLFYMEKSNGKTAVRTDWIMYEYALIDNVKAAFVLCRVFVRSRGRNSNSDHALSSCAEESVATVRHIGIQHDGSIISALGRDIPPSHDYVDEKTAAAGMSTQLTEEMQKNNLATSYGLAGSINLSLDSSIARHIISIQEGDFIELDDLD